MRYRLLFAICLISMTSLLLACQQQASNDGSSGGAGDEAQSTVVESEQDVDAQNGTAQSFGPEISAEDFAEHVRTLSSDAFGGRSPGGKFEQLTINYIRGQFQRLGLEPGNGDSYFQDVPTVGTQAAADTTLTLRVDDRTETLHQGVDMVLTTRRGVEKVAVNDSDVVFVGYGINAPEAGWNDYEGIDAHGKTVVMLVNDPGFASGDPALFEGRRMTYYGRWTYKYEEAARQGAAAALIIHQADAAGYGWDVVKNSWSGQEFDLPADSDPEPRLPLQGWLTGEAAAHLFARSGLDLEQLTMAAGRNGFKAIPTTATLTAELHSSIVQAVSHNVMAILPGKSRPDETIVYMAHWDHLGTQPDSPGEDHIFNGAVDNATGVAGMLEIAERFVTEPRPERSVMFLAVTLEESGLLGSGYFVQHPTVPLENMVAAINLDAMSAVGQTRDLVVVGYGSSELEDVLKPIAALQGRELKEESAPERGFYFRSDHFNFAKAGIPALYTKSGMDARRGGTEKGSAVFAEYTSNRYHSPRDEYDPDWDLGGIVDDLNALDLVGRQIANSKDWPNWYDGNAFKSRREALMAKRGHSAEVGAQ